MRLDKYAAYAAKSRKEIKKLITGGKVSVNGKIIKDAGFNVKEEDNVLVDGIPFKYREFIYLLMNKPAGVVSATYDPRQKTVIDLISEEDKRFEPFPVGRLDIDTMGMLILTNDGKMAHALLSPSKKVPKKYVAEVDGDITDEDIKEFENGILLDDGYKTLPAVLNPIGKRIGEVTISEGKFHQVKRMFAHCKKHVLNLRRVEFASLKMDESLKEGEYRHLTEEEMSVLYNIMQ